MCDDDNDFAPVGRAPYRERDVVAYKRKRALAAQNRKDMQTTSAQDSTKRFTE
jgi:hypothetical protein